MEVDNVANVVAEMVGDMKVNKEADKLYNGHVGCQGG